LTFPDISGKLAVFHKIILKLKIFALLEIAGLFIFRKLYGLAKRFAIGNVFQKCYKKILAQHSGS
jgi:hypothetical protein